MPLLKQTVDDAQYSLDSLCAEIMYDQIALHDNILEHKPPDLSSSQVHTTALEAWMQALEKLLPDLLAAEPQVLLSPWSLPCGIGSRELLNTSSEPHLFLYTRHVPKHSVP